MVLLSPATAHCCNAWRWLVVASSAKQKQQHHHQQLTNGSTILKTFTLPVSLDLFNLSTVSFSSISANILGDLHRSTFLGGGGGGGKVMVKCAPPRQSVVRLFFVVVCAKDFSDICVGSKLLVRNSPARPLLLLNLQVFWGPSQEPPASLAFCFLGDCFWRPLRPAWPPGTLCIRKNPSSMKLRESDFLGILVDWLS